MSARKLVALLFALSIVMAAPTGATAQTDPPSRVLIIVLDQARPDTITRYDMDNVKRLQRDGVSFPNAIVGHMAAETVISHNVLTSGLFPKHMGWTNEVYRDVESLIGGGYHVTSSMSCREFDTVINDGNYAKLQDYLDGEFGETSVFASIAQKRTSACTSGHVSAAADTTPGDAEDVIFQIRGSGGIELRWASRGRLARARGRQRRLSGPVLPRAGTTQCNRWSTWQAAGAYGTRSIPPAQIYPLDGNRFVPGFDPAHLGGDMWSADAAIRIIESPAPWHGMMVSLGGIDKLGHMWGPEDRKTGPDGSVQQMRHLPFIAKTADRQVGRIVDALEDENLLDDTLIVITADHAAQTGKPFHGDLDGFHPPPPAIDAGPLCDPPSNGIRSDCNWYFGNEAPVGAENYTDPSADFAPLVNALGSNLAFSYQDAHIALWLNGDSNAQKSAAAEAVLDLPDTIASYRVNAAHDNYTLHGTNKMTPKERAWFATHAEALVDTMAHPTGPEVVGLVADDVTWGVKGDHGGHNKLIQNIPMVFYGAGVSSADSSRELRHVDVLPTILETMGIAYDENDFDGEAVDISGP